MRNQWETTLNELRGQLSEKIFNTWIKPIEFYGHEDKKIELKVPNKFYRDWLCDHYRDLIRDSLRKNLNSDAFEIEFIYPASPSNLETIPNVSQIPSDVANIKPSIELMPLKRGPVSLSEEVQFREKFRFDTFIVGPSNQFAHAAAKAVANHPGKVYNPLFIYGGVGLGKTHLLNAISNIVGNSGSKVRVVYKTSEKFTNEWINSIHKGKTEEFRARYRDNCDILLLDDVQFLAGKEQTQVEFFHTFNTLYSARKQIVVTSDKYPKEIPLLDDRLKSRLEWGLVCDIQPPELETRVAILKKKAEIDGINLPDEVSLFVATNLKSNVRLLEGALTKLEAFSSLTGQKINLELARDLFKSFAVENKPITVERIQDVVSSFFNIKLTDLKSPNRQKVFAYPRQIAMFLCRKLTKTSFPEIGMKFGGKDHSTIIHAVQKIGTIIEKDPSLKVTVDSIEKTLLLRD
jgi:chromosomal replication initiator protein